MLRRHQQKCRLTPTRKDSEAVVQIFNRLFFKKKSIFLKRKTTALSTGGLAARRRAGLSQVRSGGSAGEEAGGGVVRAVPSFRRWLCMRESTTRVLEDSPRQPALLWVPVSFLSSSCLRKKKTTKNCQPVHEMAQASPRPRGVNVSHWQGARRGPPTPRLPGAPSPRGPHSPAELSQQIQISEPAIVCGAVPLHAMKTPLGFAPVSLFSLISLLPCTDTETC